MIWVLVITVITAGQPTQKVAVAGLQSDQACRAKGDEMIRTPLQPRNPSEVGKTYHISYECIRGVEA